MSNVPHTCEYSYKSTGVVRFPKRAGLVSQLQKGGLGGRYKLTNMLSVLATGLSEPFPLPSGDSKPESIDDSEPLELRPRAASGSSIGDV